MKKYIGYRSPDFALPFSKFYDEKFSELPEHARKALENGPVPAGSLPPPESANELLNKKYSEVETGFSLEEDGSIRVAVLTPMPRVSPKMWDWWFGWHGCSAARYKLWHPLAHQDARWKDGRDDVGYVGRVSIIEEIIGEKMEKAAIQFVSPDKLGFAPADFSDKNKVVFICARIGHASLPIDFGWLVHQVRATENGAEMRSRFWMGGRHISIRGGGAVGGVLSKIIQKMMPLPEQQARDLLVHCAEEMNHLAAFLPEIYTEFNQNQ